MNTPYKLVPTRKQNCPVCGLSINASHNKHNESPEPGDVTICTKCHSLLQFDEAMGLEIAPQAVIDEVKEALEENKKMLTTQKYTLLLAWDGLSIMCHQCGFSSSKKSNVETRYCDNCHEFLED
jgi:RNase P subunit RPR2